MRKRFFALFMVTLTLVSSIPDVSFADISSISEKQDKKDKKKLHELVNYFQNNWDSIVERMNCTHCGSCTEPLISHTLSERLSRNPLAWSKEGLGKMAMLRVFEENGKKQRLQYPQKWA